MSQCKEAVPGSTCEQRNTFEINWVNESVVESQTAYPDSEVVKSLSADLGLDAEAAARLHGVAARHEEEEGEEEDEGVLEEVSRNWSRRMPVNP